jgi:hypothetical protein
MNKLRTLDVVTDFEIIKASNETNVSRSEIRKCCNLKV